MGNSSWARPINAKLKELNRSDTYVNLDPHALGIEVGFFGTFDKKENNFQSLGKLHDLDKKLIKDQDTGLESFCYDSTSSTSIETAIKAKADHIPVKGEAGIQLKFGTSRNVVWYLPKCKHTFIDPAELHNFLIKQGDIVSSEHPTISPLYVIIGVISSQSGLLILKGKTSHEVSVDLDISADLSAVGAPAEGGLKIGVKSSFSQGAGCIHVASKEVPLNIMYILRELPTKNKSLSYESASKVPDLNSPEYDDFEKTYILGKQTN